MDWTTFYRQHRRQDSSGLLRAAEWQEELAERINKLCPRRCLEAGSGYGLTSLLVDGRRSRRVLLDREIEPLASAGRLFAGRGETAEFVGGDLFSLPFADGRFDVVFNSGVLEHFEYTGRRTALAEMLRVARPGGSVLVGLPNHYCYPYRYAYLSRKKRNRWPYPDEHRVHDLSAEAGETGIPVRQTRETVGRKTALHFLHRHQRIFFRLLGLFRPYEGYLTIITLTRE